MQHQDDWIFQIAHASRHTYVFSGLYGWVRLRCTKAHGHYKSLSYRSSGGDSRFSGGVAYADLHAYDGAWRATWRTEKAEFIRVTQNPQDNDVLNERYKFMMREEPLRAESTLHHQGAYILLQLMYHVLAIDTCYPALFVQLCYLYGLESECAHTKQKLVHMYLHAEKYLLSACTYRESSRPLMTLDAAQSALQTTVSYTAHTYPEKDLSALRKDAQEQGLLLRQAHIPDHSPQGWRVCLHNRHHFLEPLLT